MATRRLFFALWLPEAVAAALHRHALDLVGAGPGRVMRADTLHLTLAFLGDVDEARVPELLALGARVAAGRPAFPMVLDRIGHWPHHRIDWAGCSTVPDELTAWVEDLRAGLATTGVAFERIPFTPHLTLVRKRAGVQVPWVIEALPFRAEAFRLVESKREPQGAIYLPVAVWPLG
jgi:RNA 2',3'-cyclic 3'-phosphodiesterase